jgi:legumain
VTASNATTSSYACYFDKLRKTYLGDVFSVKWMEDSDKVRLHKAIVMFLFENPKTYLPAREKNKAEKITKSIQIF